MSTSTHRRTAHPTGPSLTAAERLVGDVVPTVDDIDAWLRDERRALLVLAGPPALGAPARRHLHDVLARAEGVLDLLESLQLQAEDAFEDHPGDDIDDLDDELSWLQTSTAALIHSVATMLDRLALVEAA